MILTRVKFGNSYEIRDSVVRKRNMAGEPLIFVPTIKPVYEKFRVEMGPLDSDARNLWKTFFIGAAGQEVRITDHDELVWIGFILGNPLIVESGRQITDAIDENGDPVPPLSCSFDISFEFEGRSYGSLQGCI